MTQDMTYEEAEKLYGRAARFTEFDPMFAITVRPPRADEILGDDERVQTDEETDA
jgi:hypothetical protein